MTRGPVIGLVDVTKPFEIEICECCFMWLTLLQAKSEAAKAVKRIKARAEAECEKKMRVLRTDRGRKFTSASFGKYCDEIGIQRHLTAPYSPQQNGVVERRNQTIIGTASEVIAGDDRDAWEILGRGSNDGRLSPQSVTNLKPRREDAI